jgi:hypothetical protein
MLNAALIKAGMGPIHNACDETVSDRVSANVDEVLFKVAFVANGVLPVAGMVGCIPLGMHHFCRTFCLWP